MTNLSPRPFGFIVFLLIALMHQASAQFVHTDGQKIVDANGNEIIWRGIGLGGWMLQEGYMLRTSGPQHQIEAKIVELVGEEKKAEFYGAWLANHTRKIDVDSLASWGYNLIRLPMHYKLFTPPIEEEPIAGEITWRDTGFEMTDLLLEWCEANNIYLILDLHAAPGGQGENADISDYDSSKPSLWESEANQAKTVALWRKLAERYADEPMIGGYDIINEPNWGFQNHANDPNGCAESQNTLLWNLQKNITAAIREVDQNHIVIIEGNCWGNNYSGLPALWDDNLAVSFHKYWNGNEQSNIQGMLNMRSERNVPVWLGETGENSNTWFTDCISLLESNGIGWAWWPLKKMGQNNPLQIEVNAGYQKILDYWRGSGSKPPVEEAYAALMQLTENLKLENNTYHKDVTDAMIRQPHTEETLPFDSHVLLANTDNIIHATNYDLGRQGFAYSDADYTNITGNAGGAAWNHGGTYRNDGVDIEATGDDSGQSNGYNVGWTEDGEWLQYTVQVDTTAAYRLTIRYASTGEGIVHLEIDGTDVTGPIALPATGGYQVWDEVTLEDLAIRSGTRKIRLYMDKAGFNFGYLGFFLTKKYSELPFQAISGLTDQEGTTIFLNFNKPVDPASISSDGFSISLNGEMHAPMEVHEDPESEMSIKLRIDQEPDDEAELKVNYQNGEVTDLDGNALETFSDLPVTNNIPFHFQIPAAIEAEDFFVNEGLELEDTEDTGGGQNVGYTNTGDYLEYLIRVKDAGEYKLEVRVACQSNSGKLGFQQLTKEGALLNETEVAVPVTGGWQTWQTISTTMILDAGAGILKVNILDPEFNINWFRFSGVVNGLGSNHPIILYPNPTDRYLNLDLDVRIEASQALVIKNLTGMVMFELESTDSDAFKNMDLAGLAAGLYLVELKKDQITRNFKLILK